MNKDTRVCTRNYPREPRQETLFSVGGYPQYRRRPNERTTGEPYHQTNADVVPYNPYLLLRYDAHINVEVCTSIRAVKYLYKYIHKGPDRARIEVHNEADEVTNYLDSRYVTSSEAVWHIFRYSMHDKSHVVDRLPVHMPRQQIVLATAGDEREAYERAMGRRTKLEAYLYLNAQLYARTAAGVPRDWHPTKLQPVAYEKMPVYYTWNSHIGEWVVRQRKADGKMIGRLTSASLKEQERYYLRVLLKHVHDSTSYQDLLLRRGPDLRPLPLPPDVAFHSTFRDAAIGLGLFEDDQLAWSTFQEAVEIMAAPALRRLFVMLLEWL